MEAQLAAKQLTRGHSQAVEKCLDPGSSACSLSLACLARVSTLPRAINQSVLQKHVLVVSCSFHRKLDCGGQVENGLRERFRGLEGIRR